MMYKIVDMGSWSGMDVEPLHVIKVANRGLGAHDRHELLQKRAASHVFAQLIDRGELRDGDIPIHMTALGATEFYGCFAAGTPVAMSDGRYLGIEQLSVGDAVLTADGNVGEVSYLFQRDVAESLAIDVCGLADLLRCSADHPFRVARREQFSCDHDKYKRCLPPTQGKQNICNRPIHFTRDCVTAAYRDVVTEWGTAESLREGDFLVWTCPQLTPPVTMCASEGYLLGSWLAEGSFTRNGSNKAVSAISLAIHSNETEFLMKLRTCAASLGLTCRDYTYPDGNDPNSRSVAIAGNPERFRLWHAMFNEHALYKRLPPWTCNLPRATRLAILAGYIDGDGSCAVSDKENRTTARSHGNELSLGLQRLAWSLGLPAARCCVAPKDAAANPGWNLSIANSYLGELEAFSWKVYGRDLKQTTKVHSFYCRGRMFLPVRSIVVAGPLSVYNLEVDGDHTYSGPNVDSHNCNRNGDGFKEAWCERYHDGFVKSARYYRHHKNTDPKKSYGLVKLSHYNRPMHRVELLVIANGTKEAAARNGGLVLPDASIQALMNGKPVEVSMSCKIAHDVCNNCGHKAASRNDYCTEDTCINPHTGYRGFGCRAGLTKTADDGYMQYVDNPNPHWFDISEVATHADRIAFGGLASYLKAAGVPVCGGAELAEQLLPFELLSPFGTVSFELEQQRVLSKLAAIEGKLRAATPSQADLAVLRGFKQAQCRSFDGLGEFGGRDFPRALAALSRRDTLLSPRDFVRWIEGGEIKTASALSQLHAAVPHSFTSLMFDASLERWLANNPYCPAETSLQRFDKAAATTATAFTPENIKMAAIMSPLYDETPAVWNVGSRDVPENAAALAQQYALYKLAYVTERRDRDDFEELCRLAVLQNFAM